MLCSAGEQSAGTGLGIEVRQLPALIGAIVGAAATMRAMIVTLLPCCATVTSVACRGQDNAEMFLGGTSCV